MSREKPVTVFYLRLSNSKRRDKSVTPAEHAKREYDSQYNALLDQFPKPDRVETEKKTGVKPMKVLRELAETLPEGSTIYAVRIDRITREGPFALGHIAKIAKERKIKILTLKDGDITDLKEDQQVMAMFEAYAAAKEHSFLMSRLKDYIESCKREGKPWGIYKAKANGNFRPGHKEVSPLWEEALPRVVELRELGFTIREIADFATLEFGKTFSKDRVHRLLAEAKLATKKKRPYKPRKQTA